MGQMDNFEYSREVNKGLDSIYVKYPKMRRGIAQDREIFEVCNRSLAERLCQTRTCMR
jgi:hypothetical protein